MFKKIIGIVLCISILIGIVSVSVSADVNDYKISESENNNSIGYADRIYDDYTVTGSLTKYDVDFFKFTLSSMTTVRILCMANYSTTYVGILDSSKKILTAQKTTSYYKGDYYCDFTKTLSAGTYYIELIDEQTSYTNTYCFYFEHKSSHTHYYSNDCDTTCNGCGASRTTYHSYSNSCDSTCNVCGAVRSASHSYSNSCDSTCNVCGAVRSASHSYSNSCDSTCNVCGATRSIEHTYDNPVDAYCNICEFEREISTEPILYQESNGEWYYYEEGERSTATTFVKYKGTWYFLKYGQWLGETAIPKHNGQFYYAENGIWDKTVNGLKKFNGIWYLIKNGKWANKTTTIYKSNGKYYYVKNGKVQSSSTGMIKVSQYDSRYTFYIKNGVVQKNLTNVVKIGSKTYYVKKGIWQNSSTGVKTIGKNQYYVKNGLVQTGVSGLKKVGSATFYLKKGVVQKTTGFVKVSGKYYYLKSGKLQTGKTGLVSHNGKWYYVKKGVKDTKYNGTAKYKGVTFNVKKGNATIKGYHSCSYTDATCTKPETCIYCFDTWGSAEEHDFVNTNCKNCNAYIDIPFEVKYDSVLYYRDTKFTIDSYIIRNIDRFDEGYAKIYIKTTNHTGGYSFFHINYYDEYGLIEYSTESSSELADESEEVWSYIPEGTKRIEFVRCD